MRLYNQYSERLQWLYDELSHLENLYILPYDEGRDASKLVVCTDRAGISGHELYDILVKAGFMPEMSSLYHVVLMTSAWDDEEAYDMLAYVLRYIDERLIKVETQKKYIYPKAEAVMPMHEAERAGGDVATDMIYIYPPGIPIVVPGERMTAEVTPEIISSRMAWYATEQVIFS